MTLDEAKVLVDAALAGCVVCGAPAEDIDTGATCFRCRAEQRASERRWVPLEALSGWNSRPGVEYQRVRGVGDRGSCGPERSIGEPGPRYPDGVTLMRREVGR